MEVDRKLFNDILADRRRLLEVLQGVMHHNAAVKGQYQLPKSLIRQIREAIAAHETIAA